MRKVIFLFLLSMCRGTSVGEDSVEGEKVPCRGGDVGDEQCYDAGPVQGSSMLMRRKDQVKQAVETVEEEKACTDVLTWEGHWKVGDHIGPMQLDLATDDGKLHGTGSDSVGSFTIEGTVDETTIKFIKSYSSSNNGPYNVEYDGTWAGSTYSGTYVIPETDTLETSSGGFDLTPPDECSAAIRQVATCKDELTWEGHWKVGDHIGPMQLDLATDNGKLHGTGSDSVGPFTIDGTVDETTIKFIKSYSSSNNGPYKVEYDGTWAGSTYSGTYVIPETDTLEKSSGGFDLTPPDECSAAIRQVATCEDGLKWEGHWKVGDLIGPMELDLATDTGKLHGTGSDSVGPFTIDGTVDQMTIRFIKSYSSSDNGPYIVEYDGTWDGDTYTGTYVIPETDRLHSSNGGFDLTPPSECSDAIPKADEAVPNPCPEGWVPFNGNKDCHMKGKHPGGYNNPESNTRCTLAGAGNGYNSWYPECSEIQADVDPMEVEEHSQCDADHGASHRCCGQQGTGATGVRKSCPGKRPVCENFQHNVHWGTCQTTTTTTTTTISLDGSDDDEPTTTTTTTISLDGLDDDEREVEVEDEQANRHECLNWCYSKKHKDKSWEGYKCNWYACSACPEC